MHLSNVNLESVAIFRSRSLPGCILKILPLSLNDLSKQNKITI